MFYVSQWDGMYHSQKLSHEKNYNVQIVIYRIISFWCKPYFKEFKNGYRYIRLLSWVIYFNFIMHVTDFRFHLFRTWIPNCYISISFYIEYEVILCILSRGIALTFIILAFKEVKYHFVLIVDKYNVIICLNASVLFEHVWNPFWFESSWA